MAKKIMLESRSELSRFTIAAIPCHLPDYRLSFLLNHKLSADLRKTDDLGGNYSLYFYRDDECRNSYYLISNRSDDKVLFPELKQTDFVLLIDGPVKKAHLNRILSNINSIPNVLKAFEVKAESLKNFTGFLADLELHFMKINKDNKQHSVFTKI